MYRNKLSSGRWDATGSFDESVALEEERVRRWAISMDNADLARALYEMSKDTNIFTLYERASLLYEAAIRLKEVSQCQTKESLVWEKSSNWDTPQ